MKKLFSIIRNNHDSIFKLFLFFLTLVIIVYFFPRKINFKYEYSKGNPWLHETIIANFDFPILKSNKNYKKKKKKSLVIIYQSLFMMTTYLKK